jgi:O-antigen/teichoic acid export membrane protein
MSPFARVLRNAAWNLGGSMLPLLAAAALMPFIIARLGVERFGLLSLAWVLIGYFSLFDLGLGRALTKMIAERRGTPRAAEVNSLASTGIVLMVLLGVAGGVLMAACAPLGFRWLERLPAELQDETRRSVWLVALGIPLVVTSAGLRSVLEGVQAFGVLNLIRAPAGVLLFAAPALSALVSPRLDWAIAALLVTRLLALIAHVAPCLRHVRLGLVQIDLGWAAPMLRFGGWLTVSSVVGPVIVYSDRFILGALLSLKAVAYYTAPFEIVSRLLIVPAALAGALFPALAGLHGQAADSARLQRQAMQTILLITLPLCLVGAALAEPALDAWLGAEFASHSTSALLWLLPGFAFNSLAQVPMMAMQGAGRTRAVALLHLAELPLYVAGVWAAAQSFGIAGAAAVWSLRAAADHAALTWMLRHAAWRATREGTA